MKYDMAVLNNCNKGLYFVFSIKNIFRLTYKLIHMFLTVAAPSNDPTNIPATFKLNALVLLCNRNNIIFCTCNGATYHWISYLCHNKFMIAERFKKIQHNFYMRICFLIKYKMIVFIIEIFCRMDTSDLVIWTSSVHGDIYIIIMLCNFLCKIVAHDHIYELDDYK